MSPPDAARLRDRVAAAGLDGRFLADPQQRIMLADLAGTSSLRGGSLEGACVLVMASRQIATVLALLELDGVARRLILCPPDLAAEHLPYVIATAGVDAVVSETATLPSGLSGLLPVILCDPSALMAVAERVRPAPLGAPSEWVMFTSGTTNRPKMVVHDLARLSAPVASATAIEQGETWSTFYDIRRYGGLQILLRALLGGGSMVLSDPAESVGDFLVRAGRDGVTHISGTPSHWRRALMSPQAAGFAPRYVRLSGEVADQAVLDRLAAAFPGASVAHAYASTEAGVAFSVADGREGFPADLIDRPGLIEMRVQDGSLRIRSNRTAARYLGEGVPVLADAEGFVDTGDMVDRRGERYMYVGRREGIINVGGLKVHPEEVEAVINRDPRVQMSRVRGRPSPITGAVVVADVVVRDAAADTQDCAAEIVAACRAALDRHKVPVSVKIVPSLDILATGKLARRVG
jgi:acyl-CoA synthetase (AMP-forming)/AMP-acid ligase II